MLKYSLIFILNLHLIAQTSCDSLIKSFGYEHHKVKNYDFVVYKKSSIAKPVIIYLKGSEIEPLFVDGLSWGTFPFDKPNILDTNFNYVIFAKPYLPLCTDSLSNPYINSRLSQTQYFLENGMPPEQYLLTNNLDSLTSIYNIIINHISKQKWCKNSSIYLVGASAGCPLAINLGYKNKSVKKVVVLSPVMNSRYHDLIRDIRKEEALGKIDAVISQTKVDSIYSLYEELFNNKTKNVSWNNSDTYLSWASYTFPNNYQSILKLTIPVLYVYGSSDYTRLDNDYLKLELIQRNKKNIQVKCYVNYDHNYRVIQFDELGNEIDVKYHWREVCNDVIQWLKEH